MQSHIIFTQGQRALRAGTTFQRVSLWRDCLTFSSDVWFPFEIAFLLCVLSHWSYLFRGGLFVDVLFFCSHGALSLSGLCQRVCASTVFMSELPGLMSLFPSSPGAPTLSGFCLRLCTSMLFMYSFPSLRSLFRTTCFRVAYLVSEAPMPQSNEKLKVEGREVGASPVSPDV